MVAAELRTSHPSALRGLRFVYWPIFLDALYLRSILEEVIKMGFTALPILIRIYLGTKLLMLCAKSVQSVR